MEIYLLERDDWGYDEFDAKVIVAKDELEAREIANMNVGDEGRIWTDPTKVRCKKINTIEAGEVSTSFHAG